MTTFGHEPENQGVHRQRLLAALFFLLSALAIFLPAGAKQGASFLFRASILRPFIATQQKINSARLRARETEALQAQLDSLSAILATRGSLVSENRALRALLGARDRLGPSFRASTVIRAGLGAESTFLLELGADDGVEVGAPVVDRHGLVGAILEVRSGESLGMDWTHPDFRASAMLADGTGFGIVETRRGLFREDDRLVLNGTAYHETVPEGTLVVTSGLGVYPRGIPIGIIDEVADEEGRWRKSYWLRPMVHPAGVDHVLVQVAGDSGDLSAAWPADSVLTNTAAALRLRAQADSLALLRRLLGARGDTVGSTRP